MVYFELVPHSDRVRLVNAGHFPPFVARRDGIENIPKGGAALGLQFLAGSIPVSWMTFLFAGLYGAVRSAC